MQTFILTYNFCQDYLEKRQPHRAAHFDHLTPYIKDQSFILGGGATEDPADKGVLIFNGLNKSKIDIFVKGDPYFVNGIIKTYEIQKWKVVAGSLHQHLS